MGFQKTGRLIDPLSPQSRALLARRARVEAERQERSARLRKRGGQLAIALGLAFAMAQALTAGIRLEDKRVDLVIEADTSSFCRDISRQETKAVADMARCLRHFGSAEWLDARTNVR